MGEKGQLEQEVHKHLILYIVMKLVKNKCYDSKTLSLNIIINLHEYLKLSTLKDCKNLFYLPTNLPIYLIYYFL